MIKVTVNMPDDEIETDTFPRAVDTAVDSRDRLYVYAGTRDESGAIHRTGILASYHQDHWVRAWVGGEEADDDEYAGMDDSL